MLTRDLILGRPPKLKTVSVPAWDGEVLARPMSTGRLIDLANPSGDNQALLMAQLIADSVCDAAGKPILSVDDVLAMDPSDVISAGKALIDAFSSVEEAVKNS